jgi:hypothetical protein
MKAFVMIPITTVIELKAFIENEGFAFSDKAITEIKTFT